jgi:two-component system, chemotaxis family, sensor kinase CheA
MSTEPSHKQRFVVEAREHLAGMTSSLMALERGEGDARAHFEQLLRSAHSIKGEAGFTGLRKVEQLAHAMETALENVRDGRCALTPEVIDALLSTLDRLNALVDDVEHSEEADLTDLLVRLRPLIEPSVAPGETRSFPAPAPPSRDSASASLVQSVAQPGEFPLSDRVLAAWQRHASFLYGVKLDWFQCERDFGLAPLQVAQRLEQTGTVLDSRMDFAGPALAEGLPVPPLWYRAIVSSALKPEQFAQQLGVPCAAIVRLESVDNGPCPPGRPAATAPPRTAPAATSLRIPVSLIDRMMGLAGELVLVRNQAVHSTDPAMLHLRRLMRKLDSVTNELQDAALRMRMQPVGTLFDRFPRLVRDLARQLGKQIDIRISGTEVKLDKTILETLSDPLTHLVRNCCDHGIELPNERTRTGKTPTGLIELSARQQGGRILIQIRDDGRGLDGEAIKRKALQQGVRSQDELDQLSEQQVYGLILLSGFSTAAQITDLSGRGVGMDVVKTNLEQIGGVLEINSAAGAGTVFTLSLPLTLAIVPCLLLQSGGQAYALPQRDIEEIVLLEPGAGRAVIECSHDEEVLRLRGRLLPVTRLGEVLCRRRPFTPQTRSQLVAAHHPAGQEPGRRYVAVLKFGSQRFGLVVDDLLGSEDIVVMPLHPLLRPLGIYGGTTILGDGGVALILSGEGLARHSGVAHRPQVHEPWALPAVQEDAESHTLLLFRCGPEEWLALPLGAVRRVVTIARERIQRVGDRELINLDGTAVNVLRLDQFLHLSPCPAQDVLHLILPRHGGTPVGLLASQIADTPTLPVQIDSRAYRADGVRGSVLIRGEIALLLDIDRLLKIWEQATTLPHLALPGAPGKRVLVVEDTQFFRHLVKSQLESAGHEVTLATNGGEALLNLAEASFDLVVSDIEMPVMDGLTFAQRVREEPRFAGLPLLALTTLSGAEDRRRALACGFDAYEIKLDRRSFLATVGELLQRGRSSAIVPGALDHDRG